MMHQRPFSAVGAAPSFFAQSLSARPKGRAVCGPQRRDRGTNISARPSPSFRAERPDLFFRAGLWRVGSRSRGIPLPSFSWLFGFSSSVTDPMNLRVPHPRFVRVGSYDRTPRSFFSSFLLFIPSSLSFLRDLRVPPSVNGACPDPVGVLPPLFSSLRTLRSPRSLRKSFLFSSAVSFNFQPSTFISQPGSH